MTPRGNPKLRDSPYNPVPNVLDDPDSDPNFSYYSLSESSESSDDEYYKRIRRAKKDKDKLRSKTRLDESIKKFAKLTAKLLTAA